MKQASITAQTSELDNQQRAAWAVLGLLFAVIVFGYWNTLTRVFATWQDPRYSHGYLIPFIAGIMLWVRREPIRDVAPLWRWVGVGVVLAGLLVRVAASYLAVIYVDMLTFVVCLLGAVLIVGGPALFRWSAAPLAFLIFMFPLPQFATRVLHVPLQKIATICSTYLFQTIGLSAFREGNRIVLGNDDVRLEVVDACIGLRMLTIFVALAVAIALVLDRPWWHRLLLVLSAVPIAVLVNVIRITVTGILHVTAGGVIADWVFHDWAGYFMMPMALALLYLEAQILARLFLDEEPPPSPMSFGMPARG